MQDLDFRKQTILRAIVVEYVRHAEPVASDAITHKYDLGVRSATIRSEMAEMSDLGLLEQPHTSAGRIPSDSGYRYFVDRLIINGGVAEPARKTVQNAAEGDALHEMLRETARSLSRITQLLSVAATVKERDTTVKTAVLSALDPSRALLVIVLSNGHIENRMLEVPPGITLEDIGAVNEMLTTLAVSQTTKSLSKLKVPQANRSASAEKLFGVVWGALRSFGKELSRGKLITEGEEFILAQPEFIKDAGALHRLIDQLGQADALYEAVTADPLHQVTIGSENKSDGLKNLSVIRQTFYVGQSEAGVIALVGPTRLNYEAGIPLVQFTAQALTDSLSKLFG